MKNPNFITPLLLLILVFVLSSCKGDSNENDKKNTDKSDTVKNENTQENFKLEDIKIDDNKYEPAADSVRSAMNDLFDSYVALSVALSYSNPVQAQGNGTMFKKYLKLVNDKYSVGKEALADWKDYSEKLNSLSTHIETVPDLETQRETLSEFSKLMFNVVKRYGVFDKDVYLFVCSTALDGKGGYWLSDTKDIINPYGESFKTCGKVVKHVERIPLKN
ncbi:DUF3347 domain-containing protein [Bacteroidota bacterium]